MKVVAEHFGFTAEASCAAARQAMAAQADVERTAFAR